MNKADYETLETDVLVVGGGLAGCWAALRASEVVPRVVLVDKAGVARSGITLYCHDMIGPMPQGQLEAWLSDVVEHAEYMSDQGYAEMLLVEQAQRIKQMEDFGVPFERDEKGQLFLGLGRGHVHSRVILYDGRKMMEAMRAQVVRRKVRLCERVMVTDLLTSDGVHPTGGRIIGALGIHTRTGRLVLFRAKAVVVATSIMTSKLHLAYNDNLTGDGQAMAFRAGADLSGLEFTFNPNYTCPHKGGVAGGAGLIQFQTLGAYLVNSGGERFMERYAQELKERRSNFGLLAQAIAKELMEGRGPVYFDMRHFDEARYEQTRRIIPVTIASLEAAGIDAHKELVPCRPIVAYFGASGSGGIRINQQGESSLPGLLAAGAAAQCPGYVIPLSGGFTAFCNVSGYRAGEQAGRLASETPKAQEDPAQVERLKQELLAPGRRAVGLSSAEVYRHLNRWLVQPQYGLFKNERSIREMLTEIARVKEEVLPRLGAPDIHELIKAAEVRNFVTMLEPIYLASLERKESRITHYRRDYPFRDDIDWLKWVVVARKDAGLVMTKVPVPVESGRISLKERKRIPALVQVI